MCVLLALKKIRQVLENIKDLIKAIEDACVIEDAVCGVEDAKLKNIDLVNDANFVIILAIYIWHYFPLFSC